MEKILWLDMEMTGLDVAKERVIEVAMIITDIHFNELATYHSVIKQPQEFIDNMDDWNREHHSANGLLSKIPNGKDQRSVENEMCMILDQQFKGESAVLAGNTISQDRIFIRKYFPVFDSKLHYRMLDVTSWKLIFKNRLNIEFGKENTHRALDDIKESIKELQFYLEHIQVST